MSGGSPPTGYLVTRSRDRGWRSRLPAAAARTLDAPRTRRRRGRPASASQRDVPGSSNIQILVGIDIDDDHSRGGHVVDNRAHGPPSSPTRVDKRRWRIAAPSRTIQEPFPPAMPGYYEVRACSRAHFPTRSIVAGSTVDSACAKPGTTMTVAWEFPTLSAAASRTRTCSTGK